MYNCFKVFALRTRWLLARRQSDTDFAAPQHSTTFTDFILIFDILKVIYRLLVITMTATYPIISTKCSGFIQTNVKCGNLVNMLVVIFVGSYLEIRALPIWVRSRY